MTKIISVVLTAVLCAISVTNIFADQIILKNGDRLSGKIIKQDDEKIILQTDFAGIITISKTNVTKILAEEVVAKEAIVSEVAKDETAEVKTEKYIKLSYQKEGLKEDEPIADTTVENKDKEAAEPASKSALGVTEGWDGAGNIGFSFTSGNTRTSTFAAGVRAEKSGENSKWTTYGNTLWSRNKVGLVNVTTSNAIWGGLRYDRNITKKLFAFGSYDFERDKPQLLNFRSVLGAGLGYHAIKNDQTELDVFGGAAWNKTWYVGPNTSSAELLVGNTLKHKLNDRVKIQQGFTFYPNLTNTGEYRFIFDSTLSADVTSRIGWFVSAADRYNSLPIFGVQKNDFLFTTGLKFGFGKKK